LWISSWRFLAKRFRGANNIAWYEPASEPHLAHYETPPCHTKAAQVNLMSELVAAVRSVDNDTPIAISVDYGQCPGLSHEDKLADEKIIYVVNWFCANATYGADAQCKALGGPNVPCLCPGEKSRTVRYGRDTLATLMQPALNFKRTFRVPLWIDQLGCAPGANTGAGQWLHDSLALGLAEEGVHWTFWTWKGDSPDDPTGMSVVTEPGGKVDAAVRKLVQTALDAYSYANVGNSVVGILKIDDASVQIKRPQQTVVHFNGTTEMRSNPERGFRHELDDFCAWSDTQVPRQWHPDVNGSHQMQRLFEAKPNNLTVVQAYCYLDGESDLIPAALLETLDRGFDRLRASGVKALFRFAYDHCPVDDKGEGNYTVERILKHVAQLGPTMQRNADAVYVLQAGFVGCWGEWHSSRAWMEHRQLEGNSSDIARIVAAELEQLIPPDRKMMMRYPWDKCCGRDSNGGALRSATSEALGLEWGTVDASTAHSSKAFARIGFDDDGFMCCGPTNNDGGTWGTSLYGSPTYVSEDGYTVGRGWDYERVESPFLPMDGEMYWNEGLNGSGTAQEVGVDGHAVAHRMFLHHYTTLSLRHGYSKLDGDSRAESIDRWMETPLDLRFVRKWGLPLSDAFFSLRPAQPKASCAAVQAAVPPADRVTCSKGVYPNGTMAQQQQKCLANGCCFDPVHSPGPHPWCFLSQIPAGVVALRPDYTIYAYIRDHLGYRLELQRAAFPAETTIADGSVSFSVTITLKNLGFSIPHNRRPPSFVLLRSSSGAGATNQSKSQASPIVLQTPVVDIDPRSWQPRAIGDPFSRVMLHEFTAAVHGGGKGLSPGEYKLGLYLPDERQPLQGRADYAIRVANDDVPWATWGKNHDEGGVNVLGQMLLTTG